MSWLTAPGWALGAEVCVGLGNETVEMVGSQLQRALTALL